jgi:hypothetical protein
VDGTLEAALCILHEGLDAALRCLRRDVSGTALVGPFDGMIADVNARRPLIKPPDDALVAARVPLPTVPLDDAPDTTVLNSPIATCADGDAPDSAVCDSTATVPRRPRDPGVLRQWSDTSGQAARMRGGGGANMSDSTVTTSAYNETANLPPAQSDTPCTMRLPERRYRRRATEYWHATWRRQPRLRCEHRCGC